MLELLEPPMLDPAVAFTLFDKMLAGLGLLREGKKQRTEKIEQALLALYAAIAETKSYIQVQHSGALRSREREFEIAKLWHKASVPLRTIDPEFAGRCFLKGGYWMEPEAWDQTRIAGQGISIDAVFEATRALLIE
jgi:hypothetical protein